MCSLILGEPEYCESLMVFIELRKPAEGKSGIFVSSSEYPKGNEMSPRTVWCTIEEFQESAPEALVNYFYALINLVSETCYERNYVAIDLAKAMFPMDVVECGAMSSSISPKLRAAFCRLMLTLHLDVDPQEEVIVPEYTRLFSEASATIALPGSADASLRFRELKLFIVGYLREAGGEDSAKGVMKAWEHDINVLSLNVLRICRFLMRCGAYTDVSDIQQVVSPLIDVLDGTSDLTRFGRRHAETRRQPLEEPPR